MGSHSVTCQWWLSRLYPSPSWYSILGPQRDARLSWPRWWLHPKIVYPPNTVTYLRNNQAVSWPGLEPATRRLQVQRANHYTTDPPMPCYAHPYHRGWQWSPVGWLPVYQDQLRARSTVTSIGKLQLFYSVVYMVRQDTCRCVVLLTWQYVDESIPQSVGRISANARRRFGISVGNFL